MRVKYFFLKKKWDKDVDYVVFFIIDYFISNIYIMVLVLVNNLVYVCWKLF